MCDVDTDAIPSPVRRSKSIGIAFPWGENMSSGVQISKRIVILTCNDLQEPRLSLRSRVSLPVCRSRVNEAMPMQSMALGPEQLLIIPSSGWLMSRSYRILEFPQENKVSQESTVGIAERWQLAGYWWFCRHHRRCPPFLLWPVDLRMMISLWF